MIAHSYGSFNALKIAELLERNGKSGMITFIDGSPALLKAIAMGNSKSISDEEIQQRVLAISFAAIHSKADESFVKECFCQPTWSGKVEKAATSPEIQRNYSKEYLTMILNAIFNRTKIILKSDLKVCSTSRTKATLIRPTTASVVNISENYDLDVNFKDKVEVKYLEGNHFSILENPELVENLNALHSLLEN